MMENNQIRTRQSDGRNADKQKHNVVRYFDTDEGWQGGMYRRPMDWFSKMMVRRMRYALQQVDALNLPPGSEILDVGFGSGVYLEELAARGFHCTGVDASEGMVRSTTERLRAAGVNDVRLIRGDIERMPFPDETFDLVLSMGVLGYLIDEQRAVAEVQRVLRPNGAWIVSVQNVLSASNFDFYVRRKIRSAFLFEPDRSALSDGVSVASPWVNQHSPTGHQYRMFHPVKFEQRLRARGFEVRHRMTFGFPLRLLRRSRLISAEALDAMEISLERAVIGSSIPVMRYAGDFYTAVVVRKPDTEKYVRHSSHG